MPKHNTPKISPITKPNGKRADQHRAMCQSVLNFVKDYTDGANRTPTQYQIAAGIFCHRLTVKRYIDILVHEGFLSCKGNTNGWTLQVLKPTYHLPRAKGIDNDNQ
jgi:hypothetical protein